MIVFKCKCSNHTAFILCKDKPWFQINPLPYNFPRLSFLKVFCVFWLTIVFGRTGYPALRMSNSNFYYNCNYMTGFSVQTSGLSDIRYCRIFKRRKKRDILPNRNIRSLPAMVYLLRFSRMKGLWACSTVLFSVWSRLISCNITFLHSRQIKRRFLLTLITFG